MDEEGGSGLSRVVLRRRVSERGSSWIWKWRFRM